MKIGILGTRGIPNAYGGFEQFAQHLALGLVRKKHRVSVYNSHSHPYQEKQWNGVEIIHCKDPESRLGTAGQFLYDFNCLRDARRRDFNILLQLGYTSNSVWHRIWPGKMIQIVNMDGLEWKRSKYSPQVRQFLKRAEKWAAIHADILISDSKGIQEHLVSQYGRNSFYIPYGADIPASIEDKSPAGWNLNKHRYFLLVARMEPENNIQTIIEGYLNTAEKDPLVIVGGYGNAFGRYLSKKYEDPRVRFIGPVYDPEQLNGLRFYSKLYFHGHSVGGTNPSLLEAMSCQCIIAAHNNIFNRAVLGAEAYYFSDARSIQNMITSQSPEALTREWQRINLEKIRNIYSWEKVVEAYETVFLDALNARNVD